MNRNKLFFERYRNLKAFLFVLISLIFYGYIHRGVIGVNYEALLGLILLLGLYVVYKTSFKEINRFIVVWGSVILFYWLMTLIATIYHGPIGDRALTVLNVTHTIFPFFFLLLVLVYLKPSIDYFWYLIGVATFIIIYLLYLEISAAGWDALLAGKRIGGVYSNSVKLGVFANSFFIILLGSLPWAFKKGKLFFTGWCALIVTDFLGVVFIQTRTAWIGWPEAIIGWGLYYFYMLRHKIRLNKNIKLIIFIVPFIVLWGIFSIEQVKTVVDKRVTAAYSNVGDYFAGQTFQTSVGKRILGYEAALVGIKSSPWIGIGEDAFPEFQKQMTVKLGIEKFNEKTSGFEFTHIHNQFLMSWLTKGVFSFLSVVLIFAFLIWYFTRGLQKSTFENKPIWIAGLVFSVASLLSFLPETPLQKSDTSTHFFLLSTLLIAFSILTEQRQNKLNSEEMDKE